jgi:V8-like Glu-specific endopeptidase
MKQIVLSVTLLALSLSAVAKNRVVYGLDDRMEIFESPQHIQKLASATAGMINKSNRVDLGKSLMMDPENLKSSYNMCEGERYIDQPTSVSCSGFLIAPNLLVTAGHCVQTQADCESVDWIFNYKLNEKTKKADVLISKKNVYKCKKVIESKLESNKETKQRYDYALLELDRDVVGVKPLHYRKKGMIALNEKLFVIGHPTGLPSKYAPGAYVQVNSLDTHFEANLDTFGGNSGSAVFNQTTNLVEGILVRGAKDYDTSGGCTTVQRYVDELTAKNGEAVSRISTIPTLQKRDRIIALIYSGDDAKLKTELKGVSQTVLNLKDQEGFTVLDHLNVKKLMGSFYHF